MDRSLGVSEKLSEILFTKGGEVELLKKFFGLVLPPLVKGSSVVVKTEAGYAKKMSKPRLFVRIIYLFFYGTIRSPYESYEGMVRAMALRKIANHITTISTAFKRDVFAKPISVIKNGRGNAFLLTEWVEGKQPTREEAFGFLCQLEDLMFNSGLPTWSVSLQNPRSHEDVRIRDGKFYCIDLESVMPNLFAKERSWGLDKVNFAKLERSLELARSHGYSKYEDFAYGVKMLKSYGG